MRQIAERARVNQSLLHYYFGSKENLILAVLEYVNEQLLSRQRTMYAEAVSVEAVWQKALGYFEEDVRSGYARVVWELWAQGLSNPRIRERWLRITQPWIDLVTGLVRRGLAEHRIEDAVPPEVLRQIIVNLYWGAEVEILTGREDPAVHFEAIALMGNLFRWLALDKAHAEAGGSGRGMPASAAAHGG